MNEESTTKYSCPMSGIQSEVSGYSGYSATRQQGGATHRNCVLPTAEREERRLEALADALVASLLANTEHIYL